MSAENFGEGINIYEFLSIILRADTIYDDYYLSSSLDYESTRCKLHGESIIHKIIMIIKKVVYFLIEMALINIPWVIIGFGLYCIISLIFIPIYKLIWGELSLLMCKLSAVGFHEIKVPKFMDIGGWQLLAAWHPFKTIIFGIFGNVFDCAKGKEWAARDFGSCEDRFAAKQDENGCNGDFATDYSLFEEGNKDKIPCTNTLKCPNAPQNHTISDSMISNYVPLISRGNRQGTAPFKYLQCCMDGSKTQDGSKAQHCSPNLVKAAQHSINYANKFPDQFDSDGEMSGVVGKSPKINERKFIMDLPWEPGYEDIFGPFKPVTMFESTERYFYRNLNWNLDPTGSNTCKISTAIELYNWFDVKVLNIRAYIKYLIWFFITLFILYQVYRILYNIHHGKKLKIDLFSKQADREKVQDTIKTFLEESASSNSNVAAKAFTEKYFKIYDNLGRQKKGLEDLQTQSTKHRNIMKNNSFKQHFETHFPGKPTDTKVGKIGVEGESEIYTIIGSVFIIIFTLIVIATKNITSMLKKN